jgi:archaellum component FlaC
VYTYKTGQKVKAKYEKLEDELADVKKKYSKVASDLKAVTGGARNTTENVSDIIDVVADTARKFVPSS